MARKSHTKSRTGCRTCKYGLLLAGALDLDSDIIEGLAESDVTNPGRPVSGAPRQVVAAMGPRKQERM